MKKFYILTLIVMNSPYMFYYMHKSLVVFIKNSQFNHNYVDIPSVQLMHKENIEHHKQLYFVSELLGLAYYILYIYIYIYSAYSTHWLWTTVYT